MLFFFLPLASDNSYFCYITQCYFFLVGEMHLFILLILINTVFYFKNHICENKQSSLIMKHLLRLRQIRLCDCCFLVGSLHDCFKVLTVAIQSFCMGKHAARVCTQYQCQTNHAMIKERAHLCNSEYQAVPVIFSFIQYTEINTYLTDRMLLRIQIAINTMKITIYGVKLL